MCLGEKGLRITLLRWSIAQGIHNSREKNAVPCCKFPNSFCEEWKPGRSWQNLPKGIFACPKLTETPCASLGVQWETCLFKLLFYWSWCMPLIASSALCILIACLFLLPLSLWMTGSPSVQLQIIIIKKWVLYWWGGPLVYTRSKMKIMLKGCCAWKQSSCLHWLQEFEQ